MQSGTAPGGAAPYAQVMQNPAINTSVASTADIDRRWTAWQAQGAAADQQRLKTVAKVVMIAAIGPLAWALIRFL